MIINIETLKNQLKTREIKNYRPSHPWRSDDVYGERILIARELRLWTQKDLASVLDMTECDIADFEGGRKTPTREQIEAIGQATGFPPSFFCQQPVQGWP